MRPNASGCMGACGCRGVCALTKLLADVVIRIFLHKLIIVYFLLTSPFYFLFIEFLSWLLLCHLTVPFLFIEFVSWLLSCCPTIPARFLTSYVTFFYYTTIIRIIFTKLRLLLYIP